MNFDNVDLGVQNQSYSLFKFHSIQHIYTLDLNRSNQGRWNGFGIGGAKKILRGFAVQIYLYHTYI